MSNILKQAQIISYALTEHKQVKKAVDELYSIRDGRASRTLSYLQIDQHTINKAIETASKDLDDTYTKLTYEVNKGA